MVNKETKDNSSTEWTFPIINNEQIFRTINKQINKMKKLLISLVVLLLLANVGAQNIKYVNTPVPFKEKGMVSANIVGGIEDNIYVTSTKVRGGKSLRISSYNKETSTMIKTVPLKGFGKSMDNSLLNGATFSEICVKNDQLYVVWERRDGDAFQIILQILDKDLIEVQKPKVIYQLSDGRSRYSSLFFFISPNGNKIIAGGEESLLKTDNVKVQYKLMDKDLEVLNTVQTELPYSLKRSTDGSSSEYKMDDDGFLYFMVNVNLNNESRESKKEKGSIVGSINPETSDVKTKVFSFSNKIISNSSFELIEDHLFVVGTFSTKYNKLNRNAETNNGVFTAKIDKQSFENIGNPIFNELDETKVAFSDYNMSDSKKRKYSKGEYAVKQMVDFEFLVTDYKKTEDNGLIITINSQVYTTLCSNKGGCSYFTDLWGVNYIKMNAAGEIDWISCTAQRMTYNGWVVPKNKLAYKDGNYHTVVRSRYYKNTSYLIDDKTGMVKMTQIKNKFKEEKSEAVNDQLYFVGLQRKLSSTGIGFLATGVALIPISLIVSSPLMVVGVGVGVVAATLSIYMRRHNVDFGRYELQE